MSIKILSVPVFDQLVVGDVFEGSPLFEGLDPEPVVYQVTKVGEYGEMPAVWVRLTYMEVYLHEGIILKEDDSLEWEEDHDDR